MQDYRIPKYLILASFILGIVSWATPWAKIEYQAQTNFTDGLSGTANRFPEYPPEYGENVERGKIYLLFSEQMELSRCPQHIFNWVNIEQSNKYLENITRGLLALYIQLLTWGIFVILYRKDFFPKLKIYWFIIAIAIIFILIITSIALVSKVPISCHNISNILIININAHILTQIAMFLSLVLGIIAVSYKFVIKHYLTAKA